MTSIARQSGTSEKLYYDAFGALAQRQVGTAVVSYVGKRATLSGSLASGCTTASCGVVVSAVDLHMTVGTRRIASVRVFPAAAPRTLYYYPDRLGSVVATTLAGGLPGASYRYSAHGGLEVKYGESSNSASEVGYAGALKIWMQPDPLQPFKYDYAGGDPVNRIDPTGMASEDVKVPAPNTPAGIYFDEQTGYPYLINEVIEVVAQRPPPAPESLGIVGWGYSGGRSSERPALRTFASEFRNAFKRNFLHLPSGAEEGALFAAKSTTTTLHALEMTTLAAEAVGVLTPAEVAKGALYMARNPGVYVDVVLQPFVAEAAVTGALGGAAFLLATTYEAAFESAAEATYVVAAESIFVVLSQSQLHR